MVGAGSIGVREHYGGGGVAGCCIGAVSQHGKQRVSVMHGHGAACPVHKRCVRAPLSWQGLNVQVEHALQGLRQDADVAVGEMVAWEAQLLRQGCL
jgi:hypothetical protein